MSPRVCLAVALGTLGASGADGQRLYPRPGDTGSYPLGYLDAVGHHRLDEAPGFTPAHARALAELRAGRREAGADAAWRLLARAPEDLLAVRLWMDAHRGRGVAVARRALEAHARLIVPRSHQPPRGIPPDARDAAQTLARLVARSEGGKLVGGKLVGGEPILADFPVSTPARFALAISTVLDLDDFEGLEKEATAYLKRDPRSVAARLYLLRALALNGNGTPSVNAARMQRMMAIVEDLLRERPNDPRVLVVAGSAMVTGNPTKHGWQRAGAILRRYLSLPDDHLGRRATAKARLSYLEAQDDNPRKPYRRRE